jgi:ABC-type amino acid transport substrate-binding protein
MQVIAAPGPVSYPIIAASAKNKDIKIVFSKEGKADVILDSTVSLVKRGLRINYVTIKELLSVYPNVGKRIGVWRKGSAADVLIRALLTTKGVNAELVYADDMRKILEMFKNKEIDSAVVASAFGKGITFEESLGIPGNCGAHVISNEDEFVSAYTEGIDMFKSDPEGFANAVSSTLKVDKEFVINTMKNSVLKVEKLNDDKDFAELVKKFIN